MSVTASWISSGNSGNPAASAASARRTVGTVVMAVPCLLRGVLGRSPEDLPHGRTQVRDRHLNFHEDRDNLMLAKGTQDSPVTSRMTRHGYCKKSAMQSPKPLRHYGNTQSMGKAG